MRRTTAFISFLSLAFILFSAIGAFAQTVNKWHQDGKIYFKFKDGLTADYPSVKGKMKLQDVDFLQSYINKYQVKKIKKPFYTADDRKLQNTFLVEFDDIYRVDQIIAELEGESFIEYAEPAPLFQLYFAPNDEFYNMDVSSMFGSANTSWHLNVINAGAAWDISTGDSNIVVAVLDNAIWTDHPDLQNKIIGEIDLADDDSSAAPPEATYIWSHGTHTAGLIGAETNNSIGMSSIGYDVSLLAVKLGADASGGQGMSAGFEGIVWAADNGADVISMSWGSPQYFQTMQSTINYAYNKGCVLVAAAGNNGDGAETTQNPDIPVNYVGYPAALDHVIAVASTNYDDTKASSSEYGTWIDVCSPGGAGALFMGLPIFQVLSTTASDAGSLFGGGGGASDFGIAGKYDGMSGTSMACPVAAGLAGLMLSVNPDLTPEELTAIMKASCDNIDAQNAAFVDSIGAGRINAAAALQAVIDSMTLITADFEASTISIIVGDTIDFTDLSTGSPVSWSWTFEGGLPASSNVQNPTDIVYLQEGQFSVTLEVMDSVNSDIEVKTTFILVGGLGGPESAWERQASAFEAQYRGIFDMSIADPLTAWALSYDGAGGGAMTTDFTRTTDGGQTWIPGVIDVTGSLSPGNISAVSATTAWVALYNTAGGGAIYRTDDAGVSWTHQSTATFSDAASFANVVHFFNINDGFCMGDPINGEFELYTTNDGGNNWVLVDAADIPNPESGEMGWTSVYDAVGDTVWFGTNTGRIYKSVDKGYNWTVITTGSPNISTISMNDAMNGVALAAENDQTTGALISWSMLSTADGGDSWQTVSNNMAESKSDVDAIPGVPGMVVATKISQVVDENASFYSYDYGNTWTVLDDSIQYTSVKFLNDSVGWAGSFNQTDYYDGVYKWIGIPVLGFYFTSLPIANAIEAAPYTYLAEVYDPDSGLLVLAADTTVLPAWLTFTDNNDNTGTLTGTPQFTDIGDHNVILYATNGSDTVYQSFTITVATSDIAPEFTSSPVTLYYVGTIYNYDVTATDADGDSLSFTMISGPSWLSVTDNGDNTALLSGVTYTNPPQPTVSVTLSVSDGELSTNQSFAISVPFTNPYDPPVFTSTPDTLAITDQVYTYNITTSDPDGDTLVIDAATLPGWLTFTDNGDNTGLLTGTPVTAGSWDVDLTANDGLFPLVHQTFTIHTAAGFNAPEFTSLPDTISITEQPYTYNITADDADGDVLVFSVVAAPAWLSFTDNGNSTALLTGTPDSSAVYAIVIGVTDNMHPVVLQSYNLYIGYPPVFTSVPVDTASVNIEYSYNIVATDQDDDNISLESVSIPSWLSITDNGDNTGLLQGTPLVEENGVVVIISASDDLFTVEQEFVINVQPNSVFEIIEDQFILYPNPVSEILTIEFNQNQSLSKIKMLDMLGNEILSREFVTGFYTAEFRMDLSGYSTGIYLLEINTEAGKSISKVVIQ